MAVVEIDSGQHNASLTRLVTGSGHRRNSRRNLAHRIVHAHSEDGLLTWSYTAGLRDTWNHPEFFLTGLDPYLSTSILEQLCGQVAAGRIYSEVDFQRDLLPRLTCTFREVPFSMAQILMPLAGTIIRGKGLRAFQCVYPDHHNRLPWQSGYNTSWHEVQPLFTSEMPLTRVEMTLLRAAAGLSSCAAQHSVNES